MGAFCELDACSGTLEMKIDAWIPKAGQTAVCPITNLFCLPWKIGQAAAEVSIREKTRFGYPEIGKTSIMGPCFSVS